MSDRLLKESDVLRAIDRRIKELSVDPAFIRKHGFIDIVGVKKHILAIPSADRLQGEWIFKPTFPNDDSEFPMGHLVCSVCGSHHSNSTPCNYCDNCGARMKGADDE